MNVKNIVLGVGIFIIFMFLLHNGIRAFYPAPDYNKFCNQSMYGYYPEKTVSAPQNCSYTNDLREQEKKCIDDGGYPIYMYNDLGCSIAVKDCNYCQKQFDNANSSYNKNVFVISLIIGMITILLGYFVFSLEPVSSSLLASGIGAIVYGTMGNWGNLGNMGRFLLLLIAFVLLILIAYRINSFASKK